MEIIRVEGDVAGKKVILETGRVAKQADGAVWVQCGGTVVLVTAVSARDGCGLSRSNSRNMGCFFIRGNSCWRLTMKPVLC